MIKELRPYKNYVDYVLKNLDPTKTGPRCLWCFGYKTIVADDAYNDPVEGYKMARKIPCYHCGATGISFQDEARRDYNEQIDRWKQRKTMDDTRRTTIRSIKKLLDGHKTELKFFNDWIY